MEGPWKVFNDPIHGSIELHPYLVRIIDTPQFQRLRNIRQMGGVYFVYPGASHNRFEHSIGVAHLAGEMVRALNKQHPGLITDQEGLCVQIAALCHDLGHGPFSHLFDDQFIPKACLRKEKQLQELQQQPERGKECEQLKDLLENLKGWTHEKQSQEMLDHLIEPAAKEDREFKTFMEINVKFIKELIDPPKRERRTREDKPFLYEIVSNKRNGIDVDKMDYFARDCYHLGIESNFNHKRFMKFARVCEVGGVKQICMRDKEVGNIYDLFHTRNNIHRKACQHKVVRAIDTMIVDALLEADDELCISKSVLRPEDYINMTDEIVQKILNSELQNAQKILNRIRHRNLYKCVLETRPADPDLLLEEILEDEVTSLFAYLTNELPEELKRTLEKHHIDMKIIDMTYGMKGRNPIEDMRFYRKSNPNEAFKIEQNEVSRLLPTVFAEKVIHIYCKREGLTFEEINNLQKTSQEWIRERPYMKGLQTEDVEQLFAIFQAIIDS